LVFPKPQPSSCCSSNSEDKKFSGKLVRTIQLDIHVKKLDIHVKQQKTEIYKKSVINMDTKIYNNLPEFLKEIDDYKTFKKELKLFLLLHSFYSVEDFVSS